MCVAYHFLCSAACPGAVLHSAGRVSKSGCTELLVVELVPFEMLLPGALP